jgi:hypothetical protein
LLSLAGATALSLHLAALQDQKRAELTPVTPRSDPPAPDTQPASSGSTSAATTEDATGRDPDVDAPPAPRGIDPRQATPRPRPPAFEARPATPREPPWLDKELQEKVNKAIDQGTAYLQRKQLANGSWENHYTTGMAALPALTLLECGVKPKDERIQKAACFVRNHARTLTAHSTTYEVSLSLLFLDRLGDPADRPLIQSLALRLVAGQRADGGWTYGLPVLQPEEEKTLYIALEATRPARPDALFVKGPDGKPRLDLGVVGFDAGGKPEATTQPTPNATVLSDPRPGSTLPFPGSRPRKQAAPEEIKKALHNLPKRLKNVPALQPGDNKGGGHFMGQRPDNSNTQFATLALWAAARHDLPLERSLALLAQRFRKSQRRDGGWDYTPGHRTGPAMTGAGLLGLAVGLGLAASDPRLKGKVKDDAIENGLNELSGHIGKALGADAFRRGGRRALLRNEIHLYFLWTVERVGVLYNLRKIGDKDWYPWGAEMLVDGQKEDGSWQRGGYPGSGRMVDTCFALLFLRRANLATDLTKKLEFVIQGKGAAP